MSNWDFGARPAGQDPAGQYPAEQYPAEQYPAGPDEAGHRPADAFDARQPYGPGEANYRGDGTGWLDDEWADDPDNPLTPPYPLTYERDEDGLPAGWAPWSREEDAPDRFARDPHPEERSGSADPPGNLRAAGDLGGHGFDPLRPDPDAGADGDPGQRTLIWPDGPLTQQRWRAARDQPTLSDLLGMGPASGAGHAARRGGGGGAGQGRGGGRRWLVPAGIAVLAAALGATVVLVSSGHPAVSSATGHAPASTGGAAGADGTGTAAGTATASPAPTGAPLTVAQAQGVLARYTTVNNDANAQRSDTLLGTIETGSSYAIDAGQYLMQVAAGSAAYPAFGPVQATYYIPRAEAPDGPRWFAVQVSNAFASDPHKVMSTEYLLFTQSAPGGRWQDAVEPFVLAGANTPQVALGADGLATAVSPAATSVAVPPGQLAAVTAASLDGAGPVASPGNIADQSDQRFWRGKLPTADVTDTHVAISGPHGQEFALLTTDGGALVFYTDSATLTITAPAGSALQLTVPGLYSPDQQLSSAGLSYLDQFAAYDPPAGPNAGAPRIVGDYSGITGKS